MSGEEDDHVGDRVKALAKGLPKTDGAQLKVQLPKGTLMRAALVVCEAGVCPFEDILDTSEDEGEVLYARMSPGRAMAIRNVRSSNVNYIWAADLA